MGLFDIFKTKKTIGVSNGTSHAVSNSKDSLQIRVQYLRMSALIISRMIIIPSTHTQGQKWQLG